MKRQFLSLLFLICGLCLYGQSKLPTSNQPAKEVTGVQGPFTPKKNCDACQIKVTRMNGQPAIEVILGCTHSPRQVKINGTVVPVNFAYSGAGGNSYSAVLQNAPRGRYHVSVKSQWVRFGAFYSECGGDVYVPQDVTGLARLTEGSAFCPGVAIAAGSTFRHGDKYSVTFRQRQATGQFTQLGNPITRNGNPPASLDLNALFRAQNGRDLATGTYEAVVSVSNAVSSRSSTLNLSVRRGLDRACISSATARPGAVRRRAF